MSATEIAQFSPLPHKTPIYYFLSFFHILLDRQNFIIFPFHRQNILMNSEPIFTDLTQLINFLSSYFYCSQHLIYRLSDFLNFTSLYTLFVSLFSAMNSSHLLKIEFSSYFIVSQSSHHHLSCKILSLLSPTILRVTL